MIKYKPVEQVSTSDYIHPILMIALNTGDLVVRQIKLPTSQKQNSPGSIIHLGTFVDSYNP